jgi:mannose-6-phosphate isomerase-like protein (cupin superfamily)
MQAERHVASNGGTAFEDGGDRGRVLVFGRDTGGRYSLMEYVAAAHASLAPGESPNFGPHRHHELEETFLVRSGQLTFLLDDEIIELGPGDFVRVPPGTRHGYANLSGKQVELLVSFHPGGFEELFVRHRSDQSPPPAPLGFVEDAVRLFNSEFEDHPEVR